MENSIQNILKKFKDNESSTSMIFGAVVIVVVGLLLINFLKNDKPSQVSNRGEATESASLNTPAINGFTQPVKLPTKHTIQKGEHLWGIAEKYYGSGYNWVDLARENKLKNASVLVAGTELNIPNATPLKMTVKQPQAVVVAQGTNDQIAKDSYEVQKGDTLWSIAVRAYGDGFKWPVIFDKNKDKIANARIIEVGTVLSLPR